MNHANQPIANGEGKALKEPIWNMMYCFASDDEETESNQTAALSDLTLGRNDIPRSVAKWPEPTWNMMYCFSSDDEETEAAATTATTNGEARSTCLQEVEACVSG